MKTHKFYSMALFILLFACKPEKTPAPELILINTSIKIDLEKNTHTVNSRFSPKAIYILGKDTLKNIAAFWEVSNDTIASLESGNRVYLKNTGTFQLYATFRGKKDSIVINSISENQDAQNILFDLSKNEFRLNETLALDFLVTNSENSPLVSENTSWISENNIVVSISENGLLTAIGFGETKIRVMSNELTSLDRTVSVYRSGTFIGKQGYNAGGDVILVSRNGQLFIETGNNFSVQGGPDLRIFLTNVESGSSINTEGLELSLLKSNSGKSTYVVPTNVKILDYQYIIIQCKQFKVTFGSAKLN